MSNSKQFVHNQFKKWKDAASQFIGQDSDTERDDRSVDTSVQLQPEYYEKLQQLAELRHTTVTAVVHDLLRQQLVLKSRERLHRLPAEHVESNPLLALDALTGRRQQSREEEVVYDEFS